MYTTKDYYKDEAIPRFFLGGVLALGIAWYHWGFVNLFLGLLYVAVAGCVLRGLWFLWKAKSA